MKKKNNFKKMLIGIAAVLLLFSVAACGKSDSPSKVEGDGFDTPEEAIIAYLDAFKDADLERMFSTFAVESYAKNYDLEAYVHRMAAYSPNMEIKMPNTNEFTLALNIESRRASIATSICRQFLFLSDVEIDFSMLQRVDPETELDGFIANFNQGLDSFSFQSINILGFIAPEDISELYHSQKNQENIARLIKARGADDERSVVLVFELDHSKYLLCADIINYGGKWRISQFSGNIGNLLGIETQSSGAVLISDDNYREIKDMIAPVE